MDKQTAEAMARVEPEPRIYHQSLYKRPGTGK